MKFLSITGPKADIDRMTETYLSRYEIHLENALAELTEVANLSPFLEINPYKDHLNVIDSFYEQLETPEKAVISDMTVETALKTVQNLRNKAQALDAEKSRLQSEHAEMVDSLKIIRPFRNLDFDVSQILNFKYIHYRFGRIEKQYLQKFENTSTTIWILFLSNAEKMNYIPTVFILYRNIRLTKYTPYIHPCISRGSLFLMNTMEPPQKLSKSWTADIVRSTQVSMPTKQPTGNSSKTAALRSFPQKPLLNPAPEALTSVNWLPAHTEIPIPSIFCAVG